MRNLLTFALAVILLSSCANMTTPSGGDGDVTSPLLIESKPATRSVAVALNTKFEFTFSEWVNPKSALGAITIYPTLDSGFTTKVTTRHITITPNAPLDSNQTYHLTISSDLTDFSGNKLSAGGTRIYSTGAMIDTGHISGCIPPKLTDQKDLPKVALYSKERILPNDSLLLGVADYLTQVDTLGQFNFEALKPGAYHLIGFSDKDKDNQITPGETVYIGNEPVFSTGTDSLRLISASSDITHDYITDVTIISTRELIATLSRPQRANPFQTIALTKKMAENSDSTQQTPTDTLKAIFLDSSTLKFTIPYDLDDEERYLLLTTSTVRFSGDSVKALRTDTLSNKGNISIDTTTPVATKVLWEMHTPSQPLLVIEWSLPITVLGDTIPLRDSLNKLYYFVVNERIGNRLTALPIDTLPFGETFMMTLADSLVESYNGVVSAEDTTVYTFSTPERSELTDQLQILFPSAEATPYSVVFWELIHESILYRDSAGIFKDILPGEYTTKAYFDINGNGIYDAGTLFPFSPGDVSYHFEDIIHAHPRFKVEHIVPPLIICPQKSDTILLPEELPEVGLDSLQ